MQILTCEQECGIVWLWYNPSCLQHQVLLIHDGQFSRQVGERCQLLLQEGPLPSALRQRMTTINGWQQHTLREMLRCLAATSMTVKLPVE